MSLHDALPIFPTDGAVPASCTKPRIANVVFSLPKLLFDDSDGVKLARSVALTTLRCESRSEEHTSELQSLMRISYAVFCLKKKKIYTIITTLSSQLTLPKHYLLQINTH